MPVERRTAQLISGEVRYALAACVVWSVSRCEKPVHLSEIIASYHAKHTDS